MNILFEQFILKHLIETPAYSSIVSPYVDSKFVHDSSTKVVFDIIKDYLVKYKTIPGYNEITFGITNSNEPDSLKEASVKFLETIKSNKYEYKSLEWLKVTTEEHFREVVFYNTIIKASEILHDEKKKHLISALPREMKDALAFTFDTTIGREYGEDKNTENQYEYYHNPDNRWKFHDWDYFNNTITRGGTTTKKLHFIIAGTNVGKTLFLINIAIQYLKTGLNVLYLTGEDGEERINERLDGNLLNVETKSLFELPKSDYTYRIKQLVESSKGKLIIKEFSPKKLSSTGIEHLLDELKMKKEFIPMVVIVDYLTSIKSDFFTHINNTNSYYTSVAEELRSLAIDRKLILWSAMQFNRKGLTSIDPKMDDISEAIGVAFTGDLALAILENNELRNEGKYLIKQLKSRYLPIAPNNEKWLVRVNKEKQQILEISDKPNEGVPSTPISETEVEMDLVKTKLEEADKELQW